LRYFIIYLRFLKKHTLRVHLTFIVSSLRLSGGVLAVTEFATRLAARGHEVSIVAPRDAVDESVARRLEPSVTIREAGTGAKPTLGLAAKLKLGLALARAVPPDSMVMATHTPTTPVALLASWKNGRRPFWFYQDYLEMFAVRPFEQGLLRLMPRFFHEVLVVSGSSADEIKRYGARRVTVVRQGISDAAFFHPPVDPASRERGLLLYLGDMRPRKGLFDFLSAAERLYPSEPGLRLTIVSKDECRIDTRVPFDFYYRPPRQALAELYRRCAVFVSASWWESFGLPPLEAMACGAPVVLTQSRGVSEYAVPGQNCLMVSPRDPPALADAIQRVLRDAALARRLSEAGPPTARGFHWDDCVDRFEAALLNPG